MIAVDTNVVIRLLVNDDTAQARRAHALFAASDAVFGLPGVQTTTPDHVARALAGYERGMDWADALHVGLSHEAERFCTFDAACRRLAGRAMPGIRVLAP